mmetsp:Transcript_19757/g.75745  ORF Transcript_19757/g.75745 Transcript_19757/m.75745 type:complete len:266 (-) Transcript_19757:1704-2501(-)
MSPMTWKETPSVPLISPVEKVLSAVTEMFCPSSAVEVAVLTLIVPSEAVNCASEATVRVRSSALKLMYGIDAMRSPPLMSSSEAPSMVVSWPLPDSRNRKPESQAKVSISMVMLPPKKSKSSSIWKSKSSPSRKTVPSLAVAASKVHDPLNWMDVASTSVSWNTLNTSEPESCMISVSSVFPLVEEYSWPPLPEISKFEPASTVTPVASPEKSRSAVLMVRSPAPVIATLLPALSSSLMRVSRFMSWEMKSMSPVLAPKTTKRPA